MSCLKQLLLTAAILQACVLFAFDDGMSNFVDAQIQKHKIDCCSSYEVQEAVVLYNRGVFGFVVSWDPDGTIELFNDALKSGALPLPHYTAANYYLGRLYFCGRNFVDATYSLYSLSNALRNPDLPMQIRADANQHLGTSYYKLNHYAAAIAPLNEALKSSDSLRTDQSKILALLGVSYFMLGHYADAIPFLENALNLNTLRDEDIQDTKYFLEKARKAFSRLFYDQLQ